MTMASLVNTGKFVITHLSNEVIESPTEGLIDNPNGNMMRFYWAKDNHWTNDIDDAEIFNSRAEAVDCMRELEGLDLNPGAGDVIELIERGCPQEQAVCRVYGSC